MFLEFGTAELKTGETVEMGVVVAPDIEWADRIETLLKHKGDPWNWQNSQLLRSQAGVEARFYVLHRGGQPFSHIMTVTLAGVGFLGHVWTDPPDRRKGAVALLMAAQMADFRRRGGKALFLFTGFDSPAYHIYIKHGFYGIEAGSGIMEYYSTSRPEFESEYFENGPTEIMDASWPHWPASPALFTSDFPGVIRCLPLKLVGRQTPEETLLAALHKMKTFPSETADSHVMVMQQTQSTAVVGLAACAPHPLWQRTTLVDIYCHPNFWHKGEALLNSLPLPDADRYVAYGDASCEPKMDVLKAAGYETIATLPKWVTANPSHTNRIDAILMSKS